MKWIIIFYLMMTSCFAAPDLWEKYSNAKLHIAFIYPSFWKYESCISGYKNGEDLLCLGFQNNKNANAQEYDMLFIVRPLSIDRSLNDDLSFEKKNGVWIRHTTFGTMTAKTITKNNWQGIYVEGQCKDNENYTMGDCLYIILQKNNKSIILQTKTKAAAEVVMQKIIPSMKLS
jgi:hypothetical protein